VTGGVDPGVRSAHDLDPFLAGARWLPVVGNDAGPFAVTQNAALGLPFTRNNTDWIVLP